MSSSHNFSYKGPCIYVHTMCNKHCPFGKQFVIFERNKFMYVWLGWEGPKGEDENEEEKEEKMWFHYFVGVNME